MIIIADIGVSQKIDPRTITCDDLWSKENSRPVGWHEVGGVMGF